MGAENRTKRGETRGPRAIEGSASMRLAHVTREVIEELGHRDRLVFVGRAAAAVLASERDALKDNAQERWLLIGAGLVLLGLVLGFVIKARPRRSAWT